MISWIYKYKIIFTNFNFKTENVPRITTRRICSTITRICTIIANDATTNDAATNDVATNDAVTLSNVLTAIGRLSITTCLICITTSCSLCRTSSWIRTSRIWTSRWIWASRWIWTSWWIWTSRWIRTSWFWTPLINLSWKMTFNQNLNYTLIRFFQILSFLLLFFYTSKDIKKLLSFIRI